MPQPRKLPSIIPGSGETLCPRRGTPFPALVSVFTCQELHLRDATACAAKSCTNHKTAVPEAVLIQKLNTKLPDDQKPMSRVQKQKAQRALADMRVGGLVGEES